METRFSDLRRTSLLYVYPTFIFTRASYIRSYSRFPLHLYEYIFYVLVRVYVRVLVYT